MNKCVAPKGVNQNYCECIITKIQEKYSYEEYMQLVAKMEQTRKPADELVEIVNFCKK